MRYPGSKCRVMPVPDQDSKFSYPEPTRTRQFATSNTTMTTVTLTMEVPTKKILMNMQKSSFSGNGLLKKQFQSLTWENLKKSSSNSVYGSAIEIWGRSQFQIMWPFFENESWLSILSLGFCLFSICVCSRRPSCQPVSRFRALAFRWFKMFS